MLALVGSLLVVGPRPGPTG